MGKFILLGEEVVTEPSRDNYIEVSKAVDDAVLEEISWVHEKIYSYTQLRDLASDIKDIMDKAYGNTITRVLPLLYDRDIYDLNVETFVGTYLENDEGYGIIQDIVAKVRGEYQSIIEAGELEKAEREYEMENRARWEGGGFGWQGAIKGAAQAGIMNAIEGAAYSRINARANAGTDRKVRNALDSFMQNSGIQEHCMDAFIAATMGIKKGLMRALSNFADMEFEEISDSDKLRANNIISSILAGNVPEAKVKEQLLKVWNLNPFNEEIYKQLFNRYGDADNSIQELAKKFSVDVMELKEEAFSLWFVERWLHYQSIEDSEVIIKEYTQFKEDALAELEKLGIRDSYFESRRISQMMLRIDEALERANTTLRMVDGVLYEDKETADRIRADLAVFNKIVDGRSLQSDKEYNKVKEMLSTASFKDQRFSDLIDKRLEGCKIARIESNFAECVKNFKGAVVYPDRSYLDKYLPKFPILGNDEKVYLEYHCKTDGKCVVILTDKYLHFYEDTYDYQNGAYALDIREIKNIVEYDDDMVEIYMTDSFCYELNCVDGENLSRELMNAVKCVLSYHKSKPDCFAHENEKFAVDLSDAELVEVLSKCDEKINNQISAEDSVEFFEFEGDIVKINGLISGVWERGDSETVEEFIDEIIAKKSWEIGKPILKLNFCSLSKSFMNNLFITDQYIVGIRKTEEEDLDDLSPCIRWSISELKKLQADEKGITIELRDRVFTIVVDDKKIMRKFVPALNYLFGIIQAKINEKHSKYEMLQQSTKEEILDKLGDFSNFEIDELEEVIRNLYIEKDMHLVAPTIEYLEKIIQAKKEAILREELDKLTQGYLEKTEEELEELINVLKKYKEFPSVVAESVKKVESAYKEKILTRRNAEVKQYCDTLDISNIWSVAEVINIFRTQYSDIPYAKEKGNEYEACISQYIAKQVSDAGTVTFDELEELHNKTQEMLSGVQKYNEYLDSITECMNKKGILELEKQVGQPIEQIEHLQLYDTIKLVDELQIPQDVKNYVGSSVVEKIDEIEKGKTAQICEKWNSYCTSRGYDNKGFYMRYNAPDFSILREQKLELEGCKQKLDRNEHPVMLHGTGFLGSINSGFSKGFLITSKYLYGSNLPCRIPLNEIVKFEVVKKMLFTKLFVATPTMNFELQAKMSGGQDKIVTDMLLELVNIIRETQLQNIPALITSYSNVKAVETVENVTKLNETERSNSVGIGTAMFGTLGSSVEQLANKDSSKSKVVRNPISPQTAIEMARKLGLDEIKGVTIAEGEEDLRFLCMESDYDKYMEDERAFLHIDSLPHQMVFLTTGICCYTKDVFFGMPDDGTEWCCCPGYSTLERYHVVGAEKIGSVYNCLACERRELEFEERIESDLNVEDLSKIAQFLDYLKSLAQ